MATHSFITPCFILNKYLVWYWQLCDRARTRLPPVEYTERHHVIPRCLGGAHSAWNIVVLTAREHYVAHLLLTRCRVGSSKEKMSYAAHLLMTTRTGCVVNSRLYAANKTLMSAAMMGHKRALGYKFTPEQVAKISARQTKYYSNNPEERAKISARMRGHVTSPETRAKISASCKGQPHPHRGHSQTPETRAKMLAATTLYWQQRKAA